MFPDWRMIQMIKGGYKVPKAVFLMSREEREQYEKTRKNYDPKNIFKEQNETYKKSRLSVLEPNTEETRKITQRLYGDPNTPSLWDDMEK